MLTLPTILTDYARRGGGGGYVYALEIEPSAPDSWAAKRYATASVTIGGDAYSEAIAKDITRVAQSTRLVQTGGVATFPDLTIKLINKDGLHEEFVIDNVVNRKATLQLTAISSNRILNSSFEDHYTTDFVDWIEVLGGGTITAYTTDKYDKATSVYLYGPTATGLQQTVKWRLGEELMLSAYAKAPPTYSSTVKLEIKFGNAFWWNPATSTWGTSQVLFDWDTINNTEWKRLEYALSWKEMVYDSTLNINDNIYDLKIGIYATNNEYILLDAVQLEADLEATPYHHNRYELFDDDAITIFTGIVKRPKWKHNEVSFQLEAYRANAHRTIPTEVVSVAAGSTWKIPKDSNGKPFPMTYGDFIANEHTVYDPENSELAEFARGVLANIDPAHADRILVCFDRPGVTLYHPSLTYGEYRLYHFNEDDNRYYEQSNNDSGDWGGPDQDFADELAASARWRSSATANYAQWNKIPLMVYLRAKKIWWYEAAGVTGIDNVCDADLATYMECTDVAFAPSTGVFVTEVYPFDPEKTIEDSSFGSGPGLIFVLIDCGLVSGTGTADLDLALTSHNDWGTTMDYTAVLAAVSAGTYFRNIPMRRTAGPATNKLLAETQFALTRSSAVAWDVFCNNQSPDLAIRYSIDLGGMTSPVFRIYEMGILIYSLYPLEDANYASQCYGRTFQSTWDGRKTAAALVESPAEVVESILRTELGAVTADIDTTEFDAVHTARSSSEVAGQVHRLQKSRNVIGDICREHGMLYYIDELGKHSLIALDYAATPDGSLTLHDFKEPYKNIEISQTPREAVINDIRVHYDKNQFTGDFKKLAYCNKDGRSGSVPAAYQTKCSASYTEMGNRVQEYDLYCDWVKDTATAETILKWFIDWNHRQRYIVKGPVFMNRYNIQIGDILVLGIEPMLPKSVTDTSQFIVTDKALERSKGLVNIKLLEVRAP